MKVSRCLATPGLVLGLGCLVLCCSWPQRSLAFSPKELPKAQLGKGYRAVIHVSHNRTPIEGVWLKQGSLPHGLTLEQDREHGGDDQIIHGVPKETGTFAFTMEVGCFGTSTEGQVGEKAYTIEVH